IPGMFSPVRDGEKIYIDGGLLGNLPTDIVRKMGADIVIAVHLEVAPSDPKEIHSLFTVLGRSIDVVIRDNELRGMAGADLIVNVDLHDINSLEYEKSSQIMIRGWQAAEEKSRVLAPYAVDDGLWQDYLQQRQSRERHAVPMPKFVRVEGTDRNTAAHLETFLKPLVGKPIDNPQMDALLTRLTGIGKFDSADYRLARINGEEGLLVTVQEKNYAPPLLQLGFSVDGSENEDVTFTLLTRLTFMDVAGYRSEWRN